MPLHFEENRGQYPPPVLFSSDAQGAKLFVTRDGVTLAAGTGSERTALRFSLVGASAEAEVSGEKALGGTSSYFRGTDSKQWVTGARQFGAVRVREVQAGVDLLYYGHGQEFEYDVVLRPGASAEGMRFRFEGADKLSLNAAGDLVVRSAVGQMIQHRPAVWQEVDGKKVAVSASYRLAGKDLVALQLGKYDRARELTVDPVLSFATYLGGKNEDAANAVALDSSGNVYITGYTASTDFPTSIGAYRVALNGSQNDAFVTKLNAAGTAILYSTLMGGGSYDVANGIAVDSSGNAYITGYTESSDFPTTAGSLQPTRNNAYIFVSKLNATGTGLVYSTFLGGTYNDRVAGIAVDSSGSAYLAGTTYGQFPVTTGAFGTAFQKGNTNIYASDAFVAKFNPAGSALVYGTYVGGTGGDTGAAIAIDSAGQAYITGVTTSSDFPVSSNGYLRTYPFTGYQYYGTGAGYLVCLNSAGTASVYSTYLGGSSGAAPAAVAVDSNQNAYVAGSTSSTDYPSTPGAFATFGTSGRGFVTKFNSVGNALSYSTAIGGSTSDVVHTIAVDSAGSAVITGTSTSANFPVTPGAFPLTPTFDGNNGTFLTKLNAGGTSVLYSTFFGSAANNSLDRGIALDASGNPVVVGSTLSKTFPTPTGSLQRVNSDLGNLQTGTGYATKFDLTSATLCSLSVNTLTLAVPLSGSTGNITVTTPNGCPWEAINQNAFYYSTPFVNLSNASGVGNGSFAYSVPANNATSQTRSATIRVGTQMIAVSQPAGSCGTPLLSPGSYGFDAQGGLSSISVQIPSGCVYTPASSAPWVQISSSTSLNGSATFYYFVTKNDYATRFASINVSGTPFQISQLGGSCVGTLGALTGSFGPQGGTGVLPFSVSPATCGWTAASLSPWISVNTPTGTGSGMTGFIVAPYAGSVTRSGQILVAGQVFTISQSGGGTVAPSSYTVSTIAGGGNYYSFSGDGGPAQSASFYSPQAVTYDSNGNLLIADSGNYRIRKVDTAGLISTIAGNGISGDTGDGGLGTSASISQPNYLSSDSNGNVFLSSTYRIRKITAGGIISTVAGTGVSGSPTDGVASASPIFVNGLTNDPSGSSVYFSDGGSRVRKVAGGSISYFAGTGSSGYNGDGLAAGSTQISNPRMMTTDASGNLYIAESARIRKIQGGVASTVAGGGGGTDGENISATSISVTASGLAIDAQGSLFYSDGSRIRRVTSDGKVTTIAGSPSNYGYSGDGGPALLATFYTLGSIAADKSGNIAVADFNNGRIRLLTPVYSACSYSLNGNNLQVSGTGGTANIAVTTTAGCAWNAVSNVSWISVTASGSGTGTAALVYSRNTGAARVGTVYLAGQLVSVTQAAGTAIVIGASKVGVFQPAGAAWAVDANGSGVWDTGDRYFGFVADGGDIAVVGDWTGDGKAKAGVYRNGFWILDINNNGVWEGPVTDRFIALGGAVGDIPVVGDWNGDGRSKVGIYRNGFWYLDTNGNGVWDGVTGGDQAIPFGGNAGEQPVVGDWNGDGRTKVGFMNNGTWVLDYNGSGGYDAADKIYTFPYAAGDKAVVGDWNGSKTSKIGIWRGGFWILDYNGDGVWQGPAGGDRLSGFGGSAGEVPVVGDWNGDGKTKIGYFLHGFWGLDYNGNGQWDGTASGGDRFIGLGGSANEQPIVGAW